MSDAADTYPFVSAIAWIENNRLLDICLTKGFDECCYRINGAKKTAMKTVKRSTKLH